MKKLIPVVLLLVASACAQIVKSSGGHKIMIFGGHNHRVYLGCLSCTQYATDQEPLGHGDSTTINPTYGHGGC